MACVVLVVLVVLFYFVCYFVGIFLACWIAVVFVQMINELAGKTVGWPVLLANPIMNGSAAAIEDGGGDGGDGGDGADDGATDDPTSLPYYHDVSKAEAESKFAVLASSLEMLASSCAAPRRRREERAIAVHFKSFAVLSRAITVHFKSHRGAFLEFRTVAA
jgi:hypothetical protein